MSLQWTLYSVHRGLRVPEIISIFGIGEWALAEGAIYDFFDEELHVINHPPTRAREYIVGIDYGIANPCVFVLIGIDYAQFPNMWL